MPDLDEMLAAAPIPFCQFMAWALYDPAHGYYAADRAAIGRGGDFITSVSVGPLFGRLLAGQFREMWQRLGEPGVFTIVEQGANNGDFARDVLSTLSTLTGDPFLDALRYVIVEPFAHNRQRQAEALAAWGDRVLWVESVEALPRFTGVHFSNELLDAFPVHALRYEGGAWHERYVAKTAGPEGALQWTTGPLSDPALEAALAQLPAIEGYETEVNLEALRWLETLLGRLEKGYVLIADYGFARRDYYLPDRKTGTLTGYRAQRRCDDLLAAPGEQDLTAHVEFTTLVERAEAIGCTVAGFTDQHHFMVGLGKEAFPDATAPLTPEEQRERRAFASLMHPTLMGRGFQYLALAKEAPTPLAGFTFGGNPRVALGLL